MTSVVLSVGSNIGDRLARLQSVVDAISTFGDPLQMGPGRVPATYSLLGVNPSEGTRKLLRTQQQRRH